jgi:hypothetical protein
MGERVLRYVAEMVAEWLGVPRKGVGPFKRRKFDPRKHSR